MSRIVLIVLGAASLAASTMAQAAASFPDRGRVAVVDAADVIPAEDEAALNAQIYEWVERTGHQLVVATVPTLHGDDIKDYGYQLGRAWGLGDPARNDGVILLLAPNERKVRIEVGYGLEPVLTDAVSSEILRTIVTPKLKSGDTPGALADGAAQIMAEASAPPVQQAASSPGNRHVGAWLLGSLGFIAGLFGVGWLFSRRARSRQKIASKAAASAPPTPTRNAFVRPVSPETEAGRDRRAAWARSPALGPPPSSGAKARTSVASTPVATPASPPAYVAPVYAAPVYDSYYASSPSPSPSPSSDWGSSGFDSGGGSFGGGGADSSY
jgi:uncharacterized protein